MSRSGMPVPTMFSAVVVRKPSVASARRWITIVSRNCAVTDIRLIFEMSSWFARAKIGNSRCVPSPGETETLRPSRSFGLVMPEDFRKIAALGEASYSTKTDVTWLPGFSWLNFSARLVSAKPIS